MVISDYKVLDHLGSLQWIFSLTRLKVEISLKVRNEVWMLKLINAWIVMCNVQVT
jgi:hypothetical protein